MIRRAVLVLAMVLTVITIPATVVRAVAVAAASAPREAASALPAIPGPSGAPEWWFAAWHVRELWASSGNGTGITVAVVDTGVDAQAPELRDVLLTGTDFLGQGSHGQTDYDAAAFSHGTAMAGLIAGARDAIGIEGTAPGAKILPIAVPLAGEVHTGTAPPNATARAVRYAADHGAKVISMSLGGIRDPAHDTTSCPSDLQQAVIYALGRGALVVAASGNSGRRGSPVEEPGSCLGVVSVGAVNPDRTVAPFSSRHRYLTLTAPGNDIATIARDSTSYFVGGGTSQATALASAAIALVWSAHRAETNRQILTRVLDHAVDLGPAGRDDSYGLGLIDPYTATRTGTPSTTAVAANPVFAAVQPLIDYDRASSATPTPAPAAGRSGTSLGTVRVRALHTGLDGLELTMAVVAGALGLLAVGLFVLAGLRRRWSPGSSNDRQDGSSVP